MKNVLVITYHFYPSAAVGAKRLARFCKYLPQFGFEPIVLTVHEKYYESTDEHLKASHGTVYRTDSLRMDRPKSNRWFKQIWYYGVRVLERALFPDKYIVWLPYALATAKLIFKKHRIDLIYASGPWFSTFLVAQVLKKIYRVPMVIEYRDQWALNVVYRTSARAKLHRYFDGRVLAISDGVIFSSQGLLDEYRSNYPEVDFSRALVIPNGFDPDELAGVRKSKTNGFVLTYAGNFYWPRTPDNFLQALLEWTSEENIGCGNFKFLSIGNLNRQMVKHDFNGFVELKGTLPHHQVLNHLASSDWLLLIVAPGHESNIPAKIYEYLALGRPILALCPERASVREIIDETSCGVVANINDVSDIKCRLGEIYATRGRSLPAVQQKINRYCSRTIAGQLGEYLTSIQNRQ
jgi:hypothetical protein